jgi:hypothetical protein
MECVPEEMVLRCLNFGYLDTEEMVWLNLGAWCKYTNNVYVLHYSLVCSMAFETRRYRML